MLTIFLNNKLISCDTILPLAMEVHARTGESIRFLTTDRPTYDAIRRNVVLDDAIGRVGRLTWIGAGRGPWRWLRRLRAAATIAGIILAARLGRSRILHFRALIYPPLNVIARLAPQAVWLCESDSYGETLLMRRVVEVVADYREAGQRLPQGGRLLAFSPGWDLLREPAVAHLPRRVFGPTRTRKVWIDHVRAVADRFHAEAGIGDAPETLVFVLGYLGSLPYLRDDETARVLLREVLTALAAAAGDRPIVLKPHVITDMRIVEEEIARLPPHDARFVIAHLHPSVLAVRARLVVATYYSTTLADAYTMGVPTIEYSDYSDAALAVTGGGSMNPDYVSHFVRRDPDRLVRTMRAVLEQPRRPIPEGTTGDPQGVIECLAGRARPGGTDAALERSTA